MKTVIGIPDVDYPSDGMDFFDRLKAAGVNSKILDVMAYLYRHAEPEDGLVIATYKKIQSATGASEPTIATVMKRLQENGHIEKIQNGVWRIPVEYMKDGEPYSFIRREV